MTSLLISTFVKDNKNPKSPKVRTAYGYLSAVVGIVSNLLLFLAKLAIGYISGSIAVTADATNNLSDISSNVVTIIGFRLAAKPPDREHPFGHGRAEYLAALVVSAMILIMGTELFFTSVERILSPAPIEYSPVMIAVLVVSMAVKLWQGLFNKRVGGIINSTALIATAKDSFNDVVSTAAVTLSMLLSGLFSTSNIPFDGITGVLVALFVLYSGYNIMRDTVDLLLGAKTDSEVIGEITDRIKSFPHVLDTHDIITHNYGAGHLFVSVHVDLPSTLTFTEAHNIIDEIERTLHRELSHTVVIHMDPRGTGDPEIKELSTAITACLGSLDSELSFHGLNVFDDGKVTVEVTLCGSYMTLAKRAELTAHLQQTIININSNYKPIITLDIPFH